jgi:hypothetical protein
MTTLHLVFLVLSGRAMQTRGQLVKKKQHTGITLAGLTLQNCKIPLHASLEGPHVISDLYFPTLCGGSGVDTTCFHHVVIKIRQLFLRPAACLTSTLHETGVNAKDCKCSREEHNVPSEARRSSRWLTFTNGA